MSNIRVRGTAALGDKVTYFDMMNQDGKVWTVTGLPTRNEEFGWMSGYTLAGDDGEETESDLRQYGWTFAPRETITEYVARRGITVEVLRDKGAQVDADNPRFEHHAYVLRLHLNGRTLDTPWTQGYGIAASPVDRPVSVLDCLISDATMATEYDSFEEFADSMGYDPDSRKAYAIWESLQGGPDKLSEFLGSHDEFEHVAYGVERL